MEPEHKVIYSEHNQYSQHVFNVGTRKSELALIQTKLVVEKLESFYSNNIDHWHHLAPHDCSTCSTRPAFNIVAMTTTGDKILDKPLPDIGTKSVFTRELEVALLAGQVDFVVHSLKDLPTILPDGCTIGAIMKRGDPNDSIVLKKSLRSKVDPLELLFGGTDEIVGEKFRIGTSSQRRIALVNHYNRNLRSSCIDIRGNLNTRLAKLDADTGDYDAIILAHAGLDRMGWSDRSSFLLSPETDSRLTEWCYAVGQAAIAIECRANDRFIIDFLAPLSDLETTYEALAERSLMRKLEGGCSVPLGVRTSWTKNEMKNTLMMEGIVLSIDGLKIVKAQGVTQIEKTSVSGQDPTNVQAPVTFETGISVSCQILPHSRKGNMEACHKLGVEVANKMIEQGCLDLMGRREPKG